MRRMATAIHRACPPAPACTTTWTQRTRQILRTRGRSKCSCADHLTPATQSPQRAQKRRSSLIPITAQPSPRTTGIDLHRSHKLVLAINKNRARVQRRIGELEAHDDDFFAPLDQVCGGTVDRSEEHTSE